jgi:large subunit ribosomal protein L6
MASKNISDEVILPAEVEAGKENGTLTIKGPKGEVKKNLSSQIVKLSLQQGKILLQAKRDTKKERKTVGTFKAHIKNMISGVTKGHVYTMKICSGHFPMNVSVNKEEFVIKNLFGEKVPRKTKISNNVKINVSGNEITLEGTNKEEVAGCAASIEQLAKRTKYDRRIFQDGIFITSKSGKKLK